MTDIILTVRSLALVSPNPALLVSYKRGNVDADTGREGTGWKWADFRGCFHKTQNIKDGQQNRIEGWLVFCGLRGSPTRSSGFRNSKRRCAGPEPRRL